MPVDNSRGPLLATFLALALGGSLALAQAEDNPWPRVRVPTPGPARAIGKYAAGCLQGAEELPRDGTGYLVTRLERRRYYGHPALISFVRSLGAAVHKHKLSALLVGDLAQPRGGRAKDGHASHQTGLDVDIAYEPLPRGTKLPLSLVTREALKASTVLDAKGQRMLPAFRRRVTTILDLAASDPRVARIFVNPSIKRELCDAASREQTTFTYDSPAPKTTARACRKQRCRRAMAAASSASGSMPRRRRHARPRAQTIRTL
jgi:penicillin-insensitive murein endopeptidase